MMFTVFALKLKQVGAVRKHSISHSFSMRPAVQLHWQKLRPAQLSDSHSLCHAAAANYIF